MFKEVVPGYYLCKYTNGKAYYLVTKGVYDMVQGWLSIPEKRNRAYWEKLSLDHLLSMTRYDVEFNKVQLVTWEELPLNYQLDAIALNENIRKVYGKDFSHVQQGTMNDLRNKIFRVVDSTTNLLRDFKWEGAVAADNGHMLKEVHSEPFSYPFQFVPHSSTNPCGEIPLGPPVLERSFIASYNGDNPLNTPSGSPEIEWQSNNKQSSAVKTNQMSDLFNNIPGMNLTFGKIQKGLIAISMSGELAFKDKSGNYVTIQKEGTEKTRVDVGSLKFDVDFYQVPTQELEEGDVVLLDGEFLIAGVKKNGDRSFINPITGATTNKLQRTNILNVYFYTKVVSLFDMAGGSPKGLELGGLDPMMLMLMSGQGSTGGQDIGQLLVLSQLSQAKGGDTNSMLPLLMMSGGLGGASNGENGGIGQLLMLQALSGKGGSGLFGKKAAAKVAAPRKRTPAKKAAIKKAPVRG